MPYPGYIFGPPAGFVPRHIREAVIKKHDNPRSVKKRPMARKKKKKQKQTHVGNIMTKRKVHKNEDLKLYDRKKTKKEEKKALEQED